MDNENLEQQTDFSTTGGGDPISPQEFAKKIKAKYPQYNNVDDVTLAKKMVEKYPEYKGKVNFNTPSQPKKATAGGNGVSQSASANGGSLSGLPQPKTTLIQRMQEDQMSRPKVGQEQKPVTQFDKKVTENVKKQQQVWASNKPVAQKVAQSVNPTQTPEQTVPEPNYTANSVENYVDRHKEAYKYDYDYYKPVDATELMKVTDNFDGINILGINDRDFANFLKNKTNYFTQDFKYDTPAQEQFAINEYVNKYLQDRATYLKDKFVMADPETRKNIIDESEVLGKEYERYKKEVTPAYYEAEQKKKAENRQFYENVKQGKNFTTDAKVTATNLVKGATYALADMVSSAGDLVGADDFADKLRFEKKFIEWSDENGTVTYAKGKNVKYKGNDYIVTDTGNIVDKQTKTSVNNFIDKSDMKSIFDMAEKSKTNDSVYSGRGYTYALANTVGNLAFQVLATKGAAGVAGKVGLTEANVGRIAATAPEMVTVGSMVASSTYNDTLEQLRKAGVPDEVAKGEAGKVAAYIATAGMIVTKFLPNTNANKILSTELNSSELIRRAVSAFSAEGSKGVTEMLKNSAKNFIFKSPEVIKEGAGEMVQELLENSAQKQGNYWVNSKLDQDILSTNWTKQEILDTAILSFAAGGMMGGLGKSRETFLGNNIQENFDVLSSIDSAKFAEQGEQLVNNGDITRQQFDDIKTKVENYKAYKNKLTDDVKGKTAVEVTQLMAERDGLKQSKKNLDEAFHPEIDAKIEALNAKIGETLANPDVEGTPEEVTPEEKTEEAKPMFNENIETPEGFTNRVHDSFVQLGSPTENSHVTEEGYTYRTVGQSEIDAIAETGGVFSREGKQKGGNSNTKYWTKGNGRNFYNGDKSNVIRVADENIDPNKVVSANDLEILTDKGFVPFSEYIKPTTNEETATETQSGLETDVTRSEDQKTVKGETKDSKENFLIKDQKVIDRLRDAGVEDDIIRALPENFNINDKWLMGSEGESLLSRLVKSAKIAGQAFVKARTDENGKLVYYDNGRVDMNKLMNFLSKAGSKQVLKHEVVHTATVMIMDDIKRSPELYSQQARDALAEIEFNQSYYNDLFKEGYKSNHEGASLYGLTNSYEFVAEFVSNPSFRKWILNKGNKNKNPRNYLQRIWDNIKMLLGFKKNTVKFDNEALNDIQTSIDVLMKQTRNKYDTDKQIQEIEARKDAELDTLDEPSYADKSDPDYEEKREAIKKYNEAFDAIDAKYDEEIEALKAKQRDESKQTSSPKTEDTGTEQKGKNTSDEPVLPTESSEEKPKIRLTEEVAKKVAEVGTDEEYRQYVDSIFPDSQIVGHHLSRAEFEEFADEHVDVEGTTRKNYGYYFIDQDSVEDYKKAFGNNEKAAALDLKNPIVMDYEYSWDENDVSHRLEFLTEEWRKQFIDQGHDGAIIHRDGETEYVVFDKNQIHVLGTDKDIAAFKKWKEGNNLMNETDFNKIDLSDQLGLKKAQDFLDNISKKLDDFGKGTLGINVPVAVLKGAVSAMKAAVKTAKIGADVISAGVNYVRQSEWYKNLNDSDKKEFDSKGLLSHLSDLDNKKVAEAAVKSETSGKKPLKTSIREVTGQKDQSKKITQSEAQLLRDKFKNLQRGFKQGVKDTQALKREFIDQVKQSIKGLGNFITESDAKTMLNQVGNVNENNIEKVSEVIENLVSRLENRAQKAKTNRLSKLQKRAGVKARTKYGNAGGDINKLIKLPANQIPDTHYDEYYSMMEQLAKGNAVDFDKVSDLYESIKDDIQKFIENKNENKNQPKEPESEEVRQNKEDEFKAAYTEGYKSHRNGRGNNLTDFERKVVRDFFEIPTKYLDSLPSAKLNQIAKSIEYLTSTGYLPNKVLSDVVMKYKAEATAADIVGKVGETVLKPVKKVADFINQARGREYLSDDFFKKISNNMLHHIDSTIKGIKGTTFYDNIVHPVTSGFNKSDAETNKIGHEVSGLLTKAAKKLGTGFKVNVRLQMFLRAREFESNPELRGTKVFSLDEHMRALEANKNNVEYSSTDMEVINSVYDEFKNKTSEEMFNQLTPEEKALVNFMDNRLKSQEITNRDYNNHLLGETLTYPKDYFPRKNSFVTGNEDTDNEVKSRLFGMVGATSVKGDASNERVATQANPLDFNTVNTFMRSVRESNIEKNLAFSVKQTLMTISTLKKSNNQSLIRVANALERTVKNLIDIQLNKNPYSYDSKFEQVFNKIVKNTFTRMLIDPIRLTYDVASNYSTVYGIFADKLPDIVKATKNIDNDVTVEIHKNISSTQSERMGGSRSSDYKNAMSTPLSKTSNRKAEPTFGERIVDLYKHNKLSEFSEAMGDVYYKYADLPAQHLWKYFLSTEYNKLTGNDFNGKKYLSDQNYREEVQDDLQKAAVAADKKTANYFNTGSSSEQKLKVQAGRDNWFNRMNNFLRSFTFNENKVFWDSLNGLTGFGNTTFDKRSDAFRAFTVINARGIMYAYMGQVIGDWLVKFVTDDDDEEEEELLNKKALKRSLGQHGLLIGFGNKGTLVNFMWAFFGELINENVIEKSGEKYNKFEDSMFFTPDSKSKYTDFLNNLGAEGIAVKSLVDFGQIVFKVADKKLNGEEVTKEELIHLKAARATVSLTSQLTGLPIDRLGRLTQKALDKKYPYKEKKGSGKNKGFNSFGTMGGSGFGKF